MSKKEYIKETIFKGSSGLAFGILVTLGIGLLLETIGKMTGLSDLVTIGTITKTLMAPAIGAGIAFSLGGNSLIIFSSMAASTIGASAIKIGENALTISGGEPIGALLSSAFCIYIGKKVLGKTNLDMMIVPLLSVLGGGLFGIYISKIINPILNFFGGFITSSVESNLLLSSIVIAVIWGALIISPASSVALAIALNLNGEASAAALVGCTAMFVGITVMSYKENDLGGVLALFICTPKLQLPNLTRNLKLIIPPLLGAIIASPIVVILFSLKADVSIAGMGLCAFVAPINILANYGLSTLLISYVFGCIIIPGVVSYVVYLFMIKNNLINKGDLVLPK
ncbi:PTS transporter subunit IIC [Clostridium chrysemydis]|uniref:PTS transporter subunit IIC n=1 Tax=Clostridium chrysemydis TaxID=2665504 RepID=UPI0018844413|nr:PTS sugar transporter subunit IIC [Clostridium chrysemydis]